MVVRKLPEELRDNRPVIDAMGRCRKAIIDAQDSVKPFGLTFRVLGLVTSAIDTAAWFLTGVGNLYHARGSAPGSDRGAWRDSGSGE